MAKYPDSSEGWAIPLATRQHYHIWWNENDFTEMQLQVTDLKPDDYVYVTFNYTQNVKFFGVTKNNTFTNFSTNSFPVPGVNTTGQYYHNFERKTVTVLLEGSTNTNASLWGWNQAIRYDTNMFLCFISCLSTAIPTITYAYYIEKNIPDQASQQHLV